MSKIINPKLDFLVKDAIEELSDHISVFAESHRAHIDILEIYNTRKIEVLALIVTVIISYLAVWEFFVRDLLINISFSLRVEPRLKLFFSNTYVDAGFCDSHMGLD